MKRIIFLTAAAVLVISGCAKRRVEPISRSTFLLNTFVTVTLYDSEDAAILDGAVRMCQEYEDIFSRTVQDSEIYKINHRKPGTSSMEVSEDVAEILQKGLYYSEISDGDFDVTVEPLSSLWNFTGGEAVIPDASEIESNVEKVGYKNLRLEGNTLTFHSPDTAIDLGAIAKGYIADKMKDYLIENGVASAVINLGGNVLCVGGKPDGSDFKIGLQKPFADRSETIATLRVNDMSVVSSGVYERHFVVNGVNYHHILNPRTGYPYDNGLIAVTILSDRSVDGDGLSTACFSMGLEEGLKLLDSMEGVYGYFITEDGDVHYSDGAQNYVLQ